MMDANNSYTPFYIGFGLSILSALLIGTGFIVKKYALLRAGVLRKRPGDGGLIYLHDWVWWVGLSLFALGEGVNFIAYALAPASLVTPLGGLSVLVCFLLSSWFLNECLTLIGQVGCLVCLLGSTVIVLHAPKTQTVTSLLEMQSRFFDQPFMIYFLSIVGFALVLILLVGPRLGKSNPLPYIFISSSVGSLSVVSCKGIGLGIKDMFSDGLAYTLLSPFFLFLIALLVSGLALQLYYLNRALDLFNTGLVNALLYVFFTAFVLTASAVLFREWTSLNPVDYVEIILGFALISIGVFMMNVRKTLKEYTINGNGHLPLVHTVETTN